ncbi:MAG: ABC transporter permease [Lachnospiraceae bacterium]|nr:ABC transporter permease [Lachnospiraceae bacterium]
MRGKVTGGNASGKQRSVTVGSTSGKSRRERKPLTPAARRAYGLGFGVFLIFLWAVLAALTDNSFVLPGPLEVGAALAEHRAEIFLVHFPATMEVVLYGGLLSILIGAAFAVLMDAFPLVERALYPILTVTQTIPVMCVAPVFVLWLGYSVQMRVLVVVLVNFFPVTVNLFDGLHAADGERIELMNSYGASKWQTFIKLKFPSSLPAFFSALHVAVPWAVVGAAVAEWLGAENGLGTYSKSCMMQLDAAGLLAPLFVLTAAALFLNGILTLIERRVVNW